MRAGLTATMVFEGRSFVTTLPAPIIAFSPTVKPHDSVALESMEALLFTDFGRQTQSCSVCNLPFADAARGKVALMKVTLCP